MVDAVALAEAFGSVASAILLGVLVYLEVLPYFVEPKLLYDQSVVGPQFLTVNHSSGTFKLRYFGVGVHNRPGRKSKSAEDCDIKILFPSGKDRIVSSAPIFWIRFLDNNVKIDKGVDESSAEDIMDALRSTVFKVQKVDLHRGDAGSVAIVAFGIDKTDKVFFATDPPRERGNRPDTKLGYVPFRVMVSGRDFSAGRSGTYALTTGGWNDFDVIYEPAIGGRLKGR